MNFLIFFAGVILAVNSLTVQEQWIQFKVKYAKSHKKITEDKHRFEVFKKNLKKINEHNAKYEAGLRTYWLGVNKFADLTSEEFGDLLKRQNGPTSIYKSQHVQSGAAPDSIDWREENAVLDVKDEGTCDSSWAFSATGSLEGQNILKHNRTVSLSEQQLLDCSGDYGNGGCEEGGNMEFAFNYVVANGLTTEEVYPYTATQGECKKPNHSSISIKGYNSVPQSEAALRDAVGTVGPISVGLFADPLQLYEGGIFSAADNLEDCPSEEMLLDYGALTVGYGTLFGIKYWIVKTSWGVDWGEDGYFRLERDDDLCGIYLDASYPVL